MATLQYDFRVVGLNTVMAAFRSLEQRALQHNRTISRAFGGAAGGGAGSANVRTGGRGTQHDATARAQARERERALRQQVAEQQRANAALARLRQQEIRDQERRARESLNVRRQLDRRFRQEEREEQRRQERTRLADARARRRIGASRYEAGVGALTSLGSKAASVLAVGGGAALAAGISSELRMNKTATLLAVMSKQAGEQGSIKDIQKGLVNRVREVGLESGLDRNDLVAGMMQFFDAAGRIDVAKEMLPFFAKLSDVTGASLEDIGTSAGQSYMQALAAGMTKEQATKATQDILSAFGGGTAIGSISFRDIVRQQPKLLSTAQRFNMPLADAAGLLMAFAQTSPLGGAPGAAEAATSVQRFADELSTAAPRFKRGGVDVYETTESGQRRMRNPFQITRDVLRKTGGDEQKFNEFFKNVRSVRAVRGLFTIYSQAGAGEKGMAAVDAEIGRFMKAKLSPQQINEGAAAIRETPARQFEAAFNQLKDEVGKNLLPALTEIAPAMAKLVREMKPLIEWMGSFASRLADDPLKTVGDVIRIAIVASIAKAEIGAAVRNLLIQMLTPPGLPTPGPGVPTPGPGVPGGRGMPGGGRGMPRGGPLPPGAGLLGLLALVADPLMDQFAPELAAKRDKNREGFQKTLDKMFIGGLNPFSSTFEADRKALLEKNAVLNVGTGEDPTRNPIWRATRMFEPGRGLAENPEMLGFADAQQRLKTSIAKGGFDMEAAAKIDSMTDKQKSSIETFAKAVAMFESALTGITGTPFGAFSNLFGGLLPPNRGDGPGTPSSGGSR